MANAGVSSGWQAAGMDARWLQRRVYGADHDDPDPGPQTGHEYVELSGGPLDGLLLDVTGVPAAERGEGAALITEIGKYGPGGRSCYGPAPARPQVWLWECDMP
jgi:hypothetical protein